MKTKTSFYHRTFAFAYVLLVAVIFCSCNEVVNTPKKSSGFVVRAGSTH